MATPVVRESWADDGPNVSAQVTLSSACKNGDVIVVFVANDWGGIANVVQPTSTGAITWQERWQGNNTATQGLHAKSWVGILGQDGAQTISSFADINIDTSMVVIVIDGTTVQPGTTWIDAQSATPQAQQAASTNHVIGSISPSSGDDLWIGFVCTNVNTTYGTPAGTIKRASAASRTYVSAAGYTKDLTTTGATGAITVTSSVQRLYQSFGITIRGVSRAMSTWDAVMTATDVVGAGYGDYNWNRQTPAGDGTASGIPWPIQLVNAPYGRIGKAVPFYLPVNGRRNEAEPHPAVQFKAGDDQYFGMSFALGDTVNLHGGNYQVIDQIRQSDSQGSPPMAFEILRSELRMTGGYNIDSAAPARLSYSVTLKTGIVTGQWYDLVYRIRNFSTAESTTLVDVWVNGVQILNGYTILPPTIINGDSYHKQGFYRDPANSGANGGSPEATIYQAASALGTTYASVNPAVISTTEDAYWRRTLAELNGFASWCAAGRAQAYIGEFGFVSIQDRYGNYDEQAKWNGVLDTYLKRLDALGYDATLWSSGREFDAGYPIAVQVGTAQNAPLTVNTSAGMIMDYHPSTDTYRRGVNLAGGEHGVTINGGGDVRTSQPYYHTQGDYLFLQQSGVETVRLPIAWERAQPTLLGALDTAFLTQLGNEIAWASQYGMKVIIDLHNYCRYTLANGTVYAMVYRGSNLNNTHLNDFWTQISNWVTSDPTRNATVHGYGLMNEPHDLAGATGPPALTGAQVWEKLTQECLDVIRALGDLHKVYVSGYNYSSLTKWQQSHPVPWIKDPIGNNFAYEAHHYADSTSFFGPNSGTYQQSATGPITTYAQELASAAAWEADLGTGAQPGGLTQTQMTVVPNPATDSRGIVVADDFSQPGIPNGVGKLWLTTNGLASTPPMANGGGFLRIPTQPGPVYQGLKTDYTCSLVNKVFGMQVLTLPAVQGSTALETRILIDAPAGTVAAGTRLAITQKPITGNIEFRSEINFNDATPTLLAFNLATMAWWRFYHDGTNMLFQTSADGITWTTRRTLAAAAWMNAATLRFTIETARTGGTVTDFSEVDNVNYYPVTGPVSIQDSFFAMVPRMAVG